LIYSALAHINALNININQRLKNELKNEQFLPWMKKQKQIEQTKMILKAITCHSFNSISSGWIIKTFCKSFKLFKNLNVF
jgi:hypothetical protein